MACAIKFVEFLNEFRIIVVLSTENLPLLGRRHGRRDESEITAILRLSRTRRHRSVHPYASKCAAQGMAQLARQLSTAPLAVAPRMLMPDDVPDDEI